MKSKLFFIISETVISNLIVLFFIWKLYISPEISGKSQAAAENAAGSGIFIFALIYIVIMGLISIQTYFYVIKPYAEKVNALEKAAEESKQTEQIRREFVANVSHELKTPLTSISGFIETLQAGASEDPEIRTRFIDIIAIETSRLKRLIEDLLVLSDIENKRESECIEFNVSDEITRTIEILKPIADDKDISIISSLNENINLEGSADRFRQMMLNLIENAIKYSDKGSHIWVNAVTEEEKYVVSVRDEGIGIAPEHHQRLFERFYRVDKSRSKKAGGTGLGLSIVKHIAVLFGAALQVESQVGEGTTFFVIFNKPNLNKKKGV